MVFKFLSLAVVAAAVAAMFRPAPVHRAPLAALHVPRGFTVEDATASGLVSYAMMGALDDRGRLYLCESSGNNVRTERMKADPEYRITMLEDRNGDGVYDRRTTFADKLTMPAGAAWYRGSLYVASPPDLLRFKDVDGDGVADEREVILTGWNLSSNAASMHGPILGPDGWLYITDGRHGYKIRTKEGAILEGKSSRIWRCRPDGTGLEWVAGGGFDNPVEVVFTPAGEMLGTMTYFTDPKDGLRDALMHWVEGGVYPKPHPSTGEFQRTGELMPVMTRFARIAPSGLERHDGAGWGAEFEGNLFSAQFNPHRVQRHAVHRVGSTFRTDDSDFLTSLDPEFHPTDVLEDKDGSLLVIDTGAWFVHGCPVSRISKPQYRGGVYRVKKVEPVAALPAPRAAGVFAWFRAGETAKIRAALSDSDSDTRVAAARSAGMARDREAADGLMKLLADPAPEVRRQAATALGQIGDARAVPALIAASAAASDRFIEHAIIYSLIRLGQSAPLTEALRRPEPKVRKAALIALDQMDGAPIRREQAAPLLSDPDKDLRAAALWVASHHADWSADVVGYLRSRLRAGDDSEAVRDAILAFAGNRELQALVAEFLSGTAAQRTFLLQTVARADLNILPAVWVEALGGELQSAEPAVKRAAIQVIRTRGIKDHDAALIRIASSGAELPDLRVSALAALTPRRPALSQSDFEFLLGQCAGALRLTASQTLARARLTAEQQTMVAHRVIAEADPYALAHLLDTFRRGSDEAAGQALLDALEKSSALSASNAGKLEELALGYPARVRDRARRLIERVHESQSAKEAKLRGLEPLLSSGDPSRGRSVFFGEKAGCSGCHTIGPEGGRVGPDLTTVGTIRTGHDLLEAIVYPSESFVPGHEVWRVTTAAETYSGVIADQTDRYVLLRTGPGEDIRIPRGQVLSLELSPVSIMPDGLDQSLSRTELGDVLAFLQSRK